MRKSALLAPLALSACAAAPPAAIEEPGGHTCKGDNLAQFAGRPATQELGAQMLRESGARTIRWVPDGTIITMEFNPERLTVYLKPDSSVGRASCG